MPLASIGGKIIVLGEHAVVYGHMALAGAMDTKVHCSATPSPETSLLVPAWGIDAKESDNDLLGQALRALRSAAQVDPALLQVETTLPAAAGLGSSAALSLAIAMALRPDASSKEHREIAAAGEACFHSAPSGIDVALCQHGGIATYVKNGGLTEMDVPPLSLVVGLSGLPRSTATQVAGVARRMKDPLTVAAIAKIGDIAIDGSEALRHGDLPALGTYMNQCHDALSDLGVSIDALDTMVAAAREAGALGAKLTGAGGGGAMIALAPGNEPHVQSALEALGYQAFTTRLGAHQ